MRSLFTRSAVVAASVAVVAGAAFAGSPADAAATTVLQVRQADLLPPSDTAGGGVMEFLRDGVHLKTVDPSGYARGTFKVGVPLSAVSVNFTWYGTDFAPGIKYYVDADGDGTVDGELRGEGPYGQDVWLNQDAEDFPASKLADGFFASHTPCVNGTAQPGVTDPCGSSGNPAAHGTIASWAKQLQAATGKAPVVVNGGWSLTGAPGNGVLTQITYGPNQYVFTNLPKSKVSVTAAAKKTVVKPHHKVKVTGTAAPVGPGATATLERKKHGVFTTLSTVTLPASGDFKLVTKAPGHGRLKLAVVISETNSTSSATSDVVKVRVEK